MRRKPLLVPWEDPVLDPDFDDVEEVILFEPPILATRRVGARLTRLDDDERDED